MPFWLKEIFYDLCMTLGKKNLLCPIHCVVFLFFKSYIIIWLLVHYQQVHIGYFTSFEWRFVLHIGNVTNRLKIFVLFWCILYLSWHFLSAFSSQFWGIHIILSAYYTQYLNSNSNFFLICRYRSRSGNSPWCLSEGGPYLWDTIGKPEWTEGPYRRQSGLLSGCCPGFQSTRWGSNYCISVSSVTFLYVWTDVVMR